MKYSDERGEDTAIQREIADDVCISEGEGSDGLGERAGTTKTCNSFAIFCS